VNNNNNNNNNVSKYCNSHGHHIFFMTHHFVLGHWHTHISEQFSG